MTTEEVFTDIFRRNYWGGTSSISGTGSDAHQASVLLRAVPQLLRDLEVRVLLDIPCGDFHWMRELDVPGISYIGADIVADLVARNRASYGGERREFVRLDVIRDALPTADLVLCRDCLVHLSIADIRRALRNVCASGSRYLLTTTFVEHPDNLDIATGQWRPIDLQAPPFGLPAPLRLINEECAEEDGAYRDKSLGLWEMREVFAAIGRDDSR